MKKKLFIPILLFPSLILTAQQEPKLWSSNPKALIGATIVVNPKDANDRFSDSNFYISNPADAKKRYFNMATWYKM